MVPHMFAVILDFIMVFTAAPVMAADPCSEKACVNVYTDNNQIIIEARKGSTTVKKTIAQAPKSQ